MLRTSHASDVWTCTRASPAGSMAGKRQCCGIRVYTRPAGYTTCRHSLLAITDAIHCCGDSPRLPQTLRAAGGYGRPIATHSYAPMYVLGGAVFVHVRYAHVTYTYLHVRDCGHLRHNTVQPPSATCCRYVVQRKGVLRRAQPVDSVVRNGSRLARSSTTVAPCRNDVQIPGLP